MASVSAAKRDYLVEQLTMVPVFRALLRAVEARMIGALDLARPVLDLGCGDGSFAQAALTQPLEAGIDPSPVAVAEARQRAMHRDLRVGTGGALPFPDASFATVLSNSVVEHIPEIDPTLREVHRVLRPGGQFIFTTPSEHFAEFLFFPDMFRRLGLASLAQQYERYFNRISWHYRTDSAATWIKRLEQFGFTICRWESYFSRDASHVFDLAHYYSAPTLLYRKLFRRWVIAPWRWNFALVEPILRHWYDEPPAQDGAYLFFLCERK